MAGGTRIELALLKKSGDFNGIRLTQHAAASSVVVHSRGVTWVIIADTAQCPQAHGAIDIAFCIGIRDFQSRCSPI